MRRGQTHGRGASAMRREGTGWPSRFQSHGWEGRDPDGKEEGEDVGWDGGPAPSLRSAFAASQRPGDGPDSANTSPCPYGGCDAQSRVTSWKEDSSIAI